MNTANKITMSRIFLAVLMLIVLLFPWHQVGVELPVYLINGSMTVELKYIIAGVIFVIASITDFIDGKVARKYNMVTDFGKVMDAIADKLLVNGVLIVLACNGFINVIIPVIIVSRDTIVDSIKMIVGSKIGSVGASKAGKLKTIFMMCGVTLMLFYNLPFEIWGIRVADTLIMIATVLSIISGIEYYTKNRKYLLED